MSMRTAPALPSLAGTPRPAIRGVSEWLSENILPTKGSSTLRIFTEIGNLFNGQLEYSLTGNSRFTLQGGIVDSNRYFGPVVDNVVANQKPSQRYVSLVYDRPRSNCEPGHGMGDSKILG
jgi:hypothetical protein